LLEHFGKGCPIPGLALAFLLTTPPLRAGQDCSASALPEVVDSTLLAVDVAVSALEDRSNTVWLNAPPQVRMKTELATPGQEGTLGTLRNEVVPSLDRTA